MNKVMTVGELAAFLRTVPNQNLPVNAIMTSDVEDVCITGNISYVEYDSRSLDLHLAGTMALHDYLFEEFYEFLDDEEGIDWQDRGGE